MHIHFPPHCDYREVFPIMIIECIKEGINLTNRNLQLVFLRIAVTIINLAALFIILGVPVIIAITYLGFDWLHAKDLLPFFIDNPWEFVSRYLGLLFLIGMSFIIYIIFSSLLFLYVLGGTLGSLRNSAVNNRYRFSLSSFFREANGNFSRLFWLFTFMLFVIAILALMLVVSGGIMTVLVQASDFEETLQTFLNSFIAILFAIFGILLFLAGIVIGVYSVVAAVVERDGAVDSVRRASDFIKEHPQAILFYVILLMGFIIANIVFYGVRIPFDLIPFIGPLVNIVIYLVNAFFQGYIAVLVWSALVIYYIKNTGYPVYTSLYEI